MEEYIITRDLFIMNSDSKVPTFESSRGHSWIELTLCNSTLAQKIRNWTCGEEVSCADHNIIFFEIYSRANGNTIPQHKAKRYRTKDERWETFTHNLTKNLKGNFNCPDVNSDWTECDNELTQKIKLHPDTDKVIQKFNSVITAACVKTLQVKKSRKHDPKKRNVPWWTKDLTLPCKKKAGS
jgi:hypothetical protein